MACATLCFTDCETWLVNSLPEYTLTLHNCNIPYTPVHQSRRAAKYYPHCSFIGYHSPAIKPINVAVSKRVPPSECLRNERILQAKAKYARKEVQLLMQVWVVNVIICFGVIAMCSKYKLVPSISIISGQIIHWFITSLKECKRCCYALNLRVYSEWPRRELTCKIAKKKLKQISLY